ncbi:hypothetical protein [Brevundimonas sp. GCM10030266]|uniref:hypothetical protein n=1 Tax=Brevundimonas sp. GCM10030266 TaxID=3273386 RepID=UPI00361D4E4D
MHRSYNGNRSDARFTLTILETVIPAPAWLNRARAQPGARAVAGLRHSPVIRRKIRELGATAPGVQANEHETLGARDIMARLMNERGSNTLLHEAFEAAPVRRGGLLLWGC